MDFGIDYQGGGDYGGGGYNPSYGGGGGGTQDSTEKKRRSYDEQTLIPVTLGMLSKARTDLSNGDGSLVLEDGRPLHSVKFIAAVRSVEDSSTTIVYQVEDGTGLMDVKQWLDDNNDSSTVMEMRKQTMKDNIYIKVIGQVKEFENNKMVIANTVRPLSTGNELTHHFLEVLYTSEKFKRADSIVAPPPKMASTTLGGNFGNAPFGAGGEEDARRNRVFLVFKENDNGEVGASVDLCVQLLPDMSEAEIRKHLESLSEEGNLYSTIDENHYKPSA
ncbi:replication factor A [Nitzschia inconspicua]|uniref:Replication factor A n=1 Tax=Nitzschia inconspicua TaxID=303405 RepID=A0A9K3PP04_9STRA|nr:replication factor A [Nitzschia inconspicua]KAG7359967.1 replication factor A [Nitzschia inconspicua]